MDSWLKNIQEMITKAFKSGDEVNVAGSSAALGGTGIGGIIGFFLGGPVGAAIGGLLGGFLGISVGSGMGKRDNNLFDRQPYANTVQTQKLPLGEGKDSTELEIIEFNTKVTNAIPQKTYNKFKHLEYIQQKAQAVVSRDNISSKEASDNYDAILNSAGSLLASVRLWDKNADEANKKLIETNMVLNDHGLNSLNIYPKFNLDIQDITHNKKLVNVLLHQKAMADENELIEKTGSPEARIEIARAYLERYWREKNEDGSARNIDDNIDLNGTGETWLGMRNPTTEKGSILLNLSDVTKRNDMSSDQKADYIISGLHQWGGNIVSRSKIANYIDFYMDLHDQNDPRLDPEKMNVLYKLAEKGHALAIKDKDSGAINKFEFAVDRLAHIQMTSELNKITSHNVGELAKVPDIIKEQFQPHREQVAAIVEASKAPPAEINIPEPNNETQYVSAPQPAEKDKPQAITPPATDSASLQRALDNSANKKYDSSLPLPAEVNFKNNGRSLDVR